MSKRQSLSKNRKQRQQSALERQKARSERTPQEQLKRLDRLLGAGKGAVKERARLEALIAQSRNGQ